MEIEDGNSSYFPGALSSHEKQECNEVMQKDMISFLANNAWKLVELLPRKKGGRL